MKGSRTWRGLNSNCARMALPKVSAVMPVPSEMKKTVRVCMGVALSMRSVGVQARAGWRRLQSPNYQIEFRPHAPAPAHSNKTKAALRRHAKPPVAPAQARRPGFNFWSFPMSALFSPTALVVPFENLRMTDVEAVGGKNASLGEMISQLPQGVRVPTGFATTAHAFRAVPGPRRPGRRASASAWPRWTPKTCARWPRPAPRSAAGRGPAVPGRPGAAIREAFATLSAGNPQASLRRALLGHRRRPARRLVRRPAGDLPERGGHRGRAAQDEGGVRLALQRPRHQLPRAQGLRPRRRGAVGRRAAHGALATWARPA